MMRIFILLDFMSKSIFSEKRVPEPPKKKVKVEPTTQEKPAPPATSTAATVPHAAPAKPAVTPPPAAPAKPASSPSVTQPLTEQDKQETEVEVKLVTNAADVEVAVQVADDSLQVETEVNH